MKSPQLWARRLSGIAAGSALALSLVSPLNAQSGPLLVLNSTTAGVQFGTQDLGTTSAAQALTISNGGSGSLDITAVAPVGVGAPDYLILADSCTGASLASGAVCSVSLAFSPTVTGNRNADLAFTNNASGSPQLVRLLGSAVLPGATRPAIGPIDARSGFPMYYSDQNGLALAQCLDPGLCLETLPDPTQPPSVVDGEGDNFPGEFFYWNLSGNFPTMSQSTLVEMALEGAFAVEIPQPAEQVVFARLRVRIRGGLIVGRFYRLTHPYGVEFLQATDDDGDGEINYTNDFGNFSIPSDHTGVLGARVVFPFSTWAPLSDAPAGYIGDPAIPHRITPGPGGDFLRFEELACTSEAACRINPLPVRVIAENNLFTLSGKIRTVATEPPPPPPANTAPTAGADSAASDGSPVIISSTTLLANDTDPDVGQTLTIASVDATSANGGTIVPNAGGTWTYTPAAGFSGVDTFSYTVSDGTASAVGVVSVTVSLPPPPPPPNQPPVALGDTATTDAGVAVTIPVLANDSDPDGHPLTVTGIANVVGGAVAIQADGSVRFTPDAGFSGAGSFTYTISDGNGGSASASVSVTVNAPPVTNPGLVLALGFNEAAGTATSDASGLGNHGQVREAQFVAGRFGNALSFDGVNDWVTVADSVSLELATGMTLEAWVNPSVVAGWNTVLLKEAGAGMSYELYSNNDLNRPAAYFTVPSGAIRAVTGTAAVGANAWTHLAVTYDGASMRMYVNGVLVRTTARTGAIVAEDGPLHIGGNEVWGGEWFSGLIDEVRIYNRALSATEIAADIATPIP